MKSSRMQASMWFGLGLVAGAVVMGMWFRFHWGHPPPPNPDHIIQMFARGLNLSADQYDGLRKVIIANDERFRSLFREHEEKMQALKSSVQAEIRKLLNEKQRAEFDRRMAEEDARMEKWRHGFGPGPGPGFGPEPH